MRSAVVETERGLLLDQHGEPVTIPVKDGRGNRELNRVRACTEMLDHTLAEWCYRARPDYYADQHSMMSPV